MRRKCRERFPRDGGLAIRTCITARASRTCRDACRDRWLEVSFEVSGGKNAPGIPCACTVHNFTYLVRGPWVCAMYCILSLPQATDSPTNLYAWDPSAREVNGALIYNTYNPAGDWEDPMLQGPVTYQKCTQNPAATFIDFTNQTYDKDTGRSMMACKGQAGLLLTHWGRDKWPPFSRRQFETHFLEWKCMNFD